MNKFCVDCTHTRVLQNGPGHAIGPYRCARQPLPVSLVTGKPVGDYPECEKERGSNHTCGPGGLYYLNRADAERKREEDAEKRRKGQYDLPLNGDKPE